MKKTFLLIFAMLLFSFSSTFPQLLQENFDYSAGDSLTSHGWTGHSGGTTNAQTIVSPGLTYTGYPSSGIGNAASLTTSGQDVNRLFNDSVTTGVVYASLMVNVTSAQTAGDYFFHIGPKTLGNIFMGRVFVKLAANGNLAFGLSKSSTNSPIFPIYGDSIYTTGTTYLLVLKYQFNAGANDDTVSLFINPAISLAEPIPNLQHDTSAANDPLNIGTVALRQGTAGNAPTIIVDGIRIATSWFDVLNLMPISQAREDLNSDLIPDRFGDTVTVKGIVISPNYQTSNRSYYINDGTGGLATFRSGLTSPALNLGDEVWVNGKIDHFNGLTEIVPLTDTSVVVLSDSNAIPAPTILTIAQYKADPEAYEGFLLGFVSMTKVSGTWPASGSATLKMKEGVDTVDLRIDSDTDIDGQPEPVWPRDVIGIGSQFTTYQILPRYFATDFLPPGSIPVELVSFSANVFNGSVVLSWKTATEKNNLGYAVQRSIDGQSFVDIGFVSGSGTTTEAKSYSFIDSDLGTAQKLYYRLRQIDYNGTAVYTSTINVDITKPISFSLSQNYPNPFNPSTTINFSIPVDAKVKVRIYDILGKEVFQVVNDNLQAGNHLYPVSFENVSSGVYIYTIDATGIDGKVFKDSKKMTLMK